MNIDEFIEHAQETARKHRSHADFFEGDNPMRTACTKSAEDCEWLADCLTKFKDYQQLEKQGRLIKLSCKVGDTIWYVNEDDDEYPIELEIDTILREDNKDTWYCVNDDVYGKFEFIDSDFGETVFLTESEAEARLKELRGNNE
nr:MAG TPA: hypothetical protein [Caudoviricetes sp.]